MAKGTDIYIISGKRKPRIATNIIVVEFANGYRMAVPVSLLNTLQRQYAKTRPAIGAFDITADSVPLLDTWGWEDYWECGDWMNWHQKNVQKYGRALANEKFISAWGGQDALMAPYNWCKYHQDFANYFMAQGIDVGWVLSHFITSVSDISDATFNAAGDLVDSAGNVVVNAGDIIEDVSQGAKNIGTAFKWLAIPLAIGAGAVAVDRWVYPLWSKKLA